MARGVEQMLVKSVSANEVPVATIAERLVLKVRARLAVEVRIRVLDVLRVPQRLQMLLKRKR